MSTISTLSDSRRGASRINATVDDDRIYVGPITDLDRLVIAAPAWRSIARAIGPEGELTPRARAAHVRLVRRVQQSLYAGRSQPRSNGVQRFRVGQLRPARARARRAARRTGPRACRAANSGDGDGPGSARGARVNTIGGAR